MNLRDGVGGSDGVMGSSSADDDDEESEDADGDGWSRGGVGGGVSKLVFGEELPPCVWLRLRLTLLLCDCAMFRKGS